MKIKKSVFFYINSIAFAVLLFVGGIFAGQTPLVQTFFADNTRLPQASNAADYNSAWNLIHQNYFNKSIDDKALMYSSISGMVASLNDPATLFLDPTQTIAFNNSSSGNTFAGIGVELGYRDDAVIVERMLPGSPAISTDLKQGDAIVAVDGGKTQNLDIGSVADKIRGNAGTFVDLSVLHINSSSAVDIKIKREPIHVDSMYLTSLTGTSGKKVDELVISRFTDDSLSAWETKWDASIAQIKQDNPSSLVIDLRGNPGGFFDAAVYALSDFLPKGSLAAMQQSRDGSKTSYYTQTAPRLADMNVAVLVNENTASAAEIFSGALQHYKRAVVIGTNTYGKGTAQKIYDFSDGSTLHLTTNHWLLPDGRWIQKSDPIHPDKQVAYSNDDFLKGNDPQLNTALGMF